MTKQSKPVRGIRAETPRLTPFGAAVAAALLALAGGALIWVAGALAALAL